MHAGAGSSKSMSIDFDGGGDASPTSDVPFRAPTTIDDTIVNTVSVADETSIEDDETRAEGPRDETA